VKRFEWSTLSADARRAALARPARRRETEVTDVVKRIFDDVDAGGCSAVRRWALLLDKVEPYELRLRAEVIDAARAKIEARDLAALDLAIANVRAFHQATKPKDISLEVSVGVRCTQRWRPIETCGLYAPAGSAPLFSTLIMLAAPAQAAGVPNRVAVTPLGAAGKPHPIMLAAAAACGLDSLWIVGGAQAIAALTFGAGLPRADKIFGPGNVYVAEAKRYAAALPGGPAIDVPAGPSELMVIADDGASPRLVAADLLSQAEHDADAQVILVTVSKAFADEVAAALAEQVASLPRAAIARAALAHARCFSVRDVAEAAEVANAYAPEHLSLQVRQPEALSQRIENAGAIFVGAYSAETFGDYVCGPSHVLPTDGAARAWSGVGVASFMKSQVIQELTAAGAGALREAAMRLARLENLEAHARAAEWRGAP
jgi:histidinol dehydrogenase